MYCFVNEKKQGSYSRVEYDYDILVTPHEHSVFFNKANFALHTVGSGFEIANS